MPQARANGIDIEYESFGRDGDPLILVIMGLAAQLIFWPRSLCEGLAAKGFRVVRFDNRDIGKSTHLSGRTAPEPRALLAEVASGKIPESHIRSMIWPTTRSASWTRSAPAAPTLSAPQWAA